MYEDWLKEQLAERPHGSKGKLAEHMGIDGPKLSKTLAGERELSARELERAVAFFGKAPPGFQQATTTKIVGRARAATDGAIAFDEDGELGAVELPPGAPPTSVAIEVEGYSMGFLADGALVFYSEQQTAPSDDMLGMIVIVGLPEGEVLLKRLLRGSKPGLFDLESINGPTLRDRKVAWAAHVDSIVPPWRAARLRLESGDVSL